MCVCVCVVCVGGGGGFSYIRYRCIVRCSPSGCGSLAVWSENGLRFSMVVFTREKGIGVRSQKGYEKLLLIV